MVIDDGRHLAAGPVHHADVPQSAKLRPRAPERHRPTIPEMMEVVRQDIRRLATWGFEMVRHDYTCFDLLGRWGSAMGSELTDGGWHFIVFGRERTICTRHRGQGAAR